MTLQIDKLRQWQRKPAWHLLDLLRSGQNAVDTSDCGIGKTYVAASIASALQVPTLVVCPKIAVAQWHAAAEHFGDTLSVVSHEMLRSGNSPFGYWDFPLPKDSESREFFQCVVCQCKVDFENFFGCHCHPSGIHCLVQKKKLHRYGKFNFAPQIGFLIVDEIHRFNAPDSLNCDVLVSARRQNIPTLGLSATLGSSPLHFRGLGYLLGLHGLNQDELKVHNGAIRTERPSFRHWAGRHKVRPDPATPSRPLRWYAGEAEQQSIMRDIRAEIIPSRGVRIRKADVPNFPEVEITAELFNLDGAGQIDQIYKTMHAALSALSDRSSFDVDPESAITAMLRANQRVELLKVPLAHELAMGYADQGYSIGIFCNFQQTIDELAKRLNTECIVSGKHSVYRERNIADFQEHRSRFILINNACGGAALSLPDLDGEHPRGGLIFPSFKAVDIKQIVGRFPRDSSLSKSWYKLLLAAGTGDVKIHRILRTKLNNLDSLNDGDMLPENLTISKSSR